MTVDEVEIIRPFKDLRNVQVLGDFGINRRIFLVTSVDNGMQACGGLRITGGKECDVPAARDQAFRDIAGDRFPGPVLMRGRAPSNRRQNGNAILRGRRGYADSGSRAASTSFTGTVANPVAWSAIAYGMINSLP